MIDIIKHSLFIVLSFSAIVVSMMSVAVTQSCNGGKRIYRKWSTKYSLSCIILGGSAASINDESPGPYIIYLYRMIILIVSVYIIHRPIKPV